MSLATKHFLLHHLVCIQQRDKEGIIILSLQMTETEAQRGKVTCSGSHSW